jgi:hypothetical protein
LYKYLIVGCGGSGGQTLAYMMDQLSSDLAAQGVEGIPSGWQFVHVDVPNAPDTRIRGMGNVFQQGGTYISTGPQSGSYEVLDNGLSQSLSQNGALERIGTWAPRSPSGIKVGIGNGAGQMRAVGRAITLSKATAVYEGLERAFNRLNTVDTNTAMADVARRAPGVGSFDAARRPIVLVVSSMAGGAGASMALDVCRLLASVPGVDPALTGVFMVTPDVFDSLPESARGGVRPNALAMLGEIIATQTNSAEEHDIAILSALGHNISPSGRAPFQRVFPVGRFVGTERTLFGDGSQTAVYRGLGRGLAALVSSGSATGDFVEFDLVNAGDANPADSDYLGWGTDPGETPWGAFGFASLSMGRDRYRQYAAQRLARSTADHLRGGHLQAGNAASGVTQINALLDSQWSRITTAIGLPSIDGIAQLSHEQALHWFTSVALSHADAQRVATSITDEHFTPYVPQATSTSAQWLPALRQFLIERKAVIASAAAETAYRWSFTWSKGLHERILAQVEEAVGLFGLPYARAMVDRLDTLFRDQLAARLAELSARGVADLGLVPTKFETDVATSKGNLANGPQLLKSLVGLFTEQTKDTVYLRAAGAARGVLLTIGTDVLLPLREALNESLASLENAAAAPTSQVGLANVATDQYFAWPSDADTSVPSRFDVADNEILLTPSVGFDRQYESDLVRAAGSAHGATFADAREQTVRAVVSGLWPVSAGYSAPGGLLERVSPWRAAQFNRDPFTGTPLTPSRAQYRFRLTPADLLARSLLFVSRKAESFDVFCTLSLHDYARGLDIADSARAARHNDLVAKFNETMSRALPLISVNSDAVIAIHGAPAVYRFKFSDVPFSDSPAVVTSLSQGIKSRANVAVETMDAFDRALNSDDKLTRIDIFGSYRNYSPLVFDSLLVPVSKQWAATHSNGKTEFWANRRTRPLPASLPMGDEERRAMITGWYVGQITGRLRIPKAPFDSAVEIWDAENTRWTTFPHPLLTPPSQFIGKSVDWLPAVMESYLLAIARAHDAPVMSSLRPYQLLRRLSDDTPGTPASGLQQLSSELLLSSWLATGNVPGGIPSVITGSTLDERYDAAAEWLGKIHAFTGINYLPPQRGGALGGGPMSQIRSRREASATPIFRDLAEDIYRVTDDLIEVMTRAKTLAESGEGQVAAAHGGGIVAPEPDFGAF